MATQNSTIVSNFEATPPVLNNTTAVGGRVRVAQGCSG